MSHGSGGWGEILWRGVADLEKKGVIIAKNRGSVRIEVAERYAIMTLIEVASLIQDAALSCCLSGAFTGGRVSNHRLTAQVASCHPPGCTGSVPGRPSAELP